MDTGSGKSEGHTPIATPLAKLSMPRLAQGIARPRLFKLLDEGRERASVWIAAPGGAGKTTLAATYIAERNLPFLWFQLDEDDTDPATFFYYLGLAAKQASTDQNLFLPLLTPEYLSDIPGFARRYFRTLYAALPPGTVLVFDNYQALGNAALFSEIVRSAISETPPGAHLMVISRSDPPPELTRQRALGALSVIDWDALRLTQDETLAIASQSQVTVQEARIRELHQRCDGWAAGLTLLLEQIKRKGADEWNFGTGSLETVFHFFASEFFDDLSEAMRDFLLKTALLAHMTPTLAASVSDNPEASLILADLHRRHYFTNRRELTGVSYQYHDLFREFLLARAAETYTRAQYGALTQRAGRLLCEHQRPEEAVALHLRAQDWEIATPLIFQLAPHLLGQGRAQIVAGWIVQMPEALVESTPWLLYWRGVSQMAVRPFDALDDLRHASSGFDETGDSIGRMVTASAIIDITYLLRQSLLLAAPWLDVLHQELALNRHLLSPAIESRLLTSVLSVLVYMQPQDTRLPRYAQRLSVLLNDDGLDVNQKVLIGAHLVHYYSRVVGDLQACERCAVQIRTLLCSPEVTVLNQIMWRLLSSPYPTMAYHNVDAYETVMPLQALVRDSNLVFMEGIASVHFNVVLLSIGERINLLPFIAHLERLLNNAHPADLAWYTMAKSIHALNCEDYEGAISFGETALRLTSDVGATLIVIDIHHLLAIAYSELGDIESALAHMEMPNEIDYANSPRIRSQAKQIEAYTYLKQGELTKCYTLLRDAFSIAHERGYYGSWLCWYTPMMTRLCAEALRAGIEVDYVRQLIRKRGLLPEDTGIDNWPWPVRIYTLGQFKVVIDDDVITETKTQRKPLALLQVLIALGGSEVKVERIAEILWPDAEGDAAVSAFTTTLSRLRKLIGDSLVVRGGRVSLDERRCWVDVRALEYQLDRADGLGDDASAHLDQAKKIIALYRGAFLSDEEGNWPRRLRNLLRAKLSRCLSRCVRVLQAAGEHTLAEALLTRVMEVDPESEDIYLALQS